MLPSHLPTTADWRHIQATSLFFVLLVLEIKRQFYSGCTTWTMMAQLTSRCSKQCLVLVFLSFCILKQEFLIVLTVMNGSSAEKKLRQIFRFPQIGGTFSEKGLICRIFDADQNGLISKDEVRKFKESIVYLWIGRSVYSHTICIICITYSAAPGADENFRWSALCPICFIWCQKMHLTLSTPQKRFDLTNDVGVILKILWHLIYPQTCKIVSAFGWALHGDGLGLWRSDHRRRAHNCFL